MKDLIPESGTILVVDDIPANLGVLTDVLSEANFTVLVAEDGESALQKLEYVTPDLILLDVMMPGIDGFETYKRLRENPLNSKIPVIFITALSQPSYVIKGLSLGAVDYITKPFQKEEVLARIKTHLELRRLTKMLEQKNQHLSEEIYEHAKARADVQRLNQKLEIRVKERTIELSKTLENLYKSQDLLEYNALHDSLTGLPNRDWLMQRLKYLIATDSSYSVLFLDLDRFKIINDSLGHLVGDELLKCVAHRIQECLTPPQTATRMGGDEFVVLADTETPISLTEKLLEQFKFPFSFNGYEMIIEISIGITSSAMGYQEPMDILRDVDIAMYRAKKFGSGSYQIFNPQMQAEVTARLQLEQDLRKAIPQQEFCLYYQPIVSLVTGKIKAVEALVRWKHPQGMIAPDQFISVTEETGLINPLGWWILREACSQLKAWQEQFPDLLLKMNVNFSSVQFQQINLLEQVAKILKETGISKNTLSIEITEFCLFQTPNSNFQLLEEIGVGLCLDDFCTGYSSLRLLRDLPINTLKIDRSFVQDLINYPNDTTLIETILLLGKSLNLEVIAEGVETQEQAKILRELGCIWAQGYLFSYPLDYQGATQFITENQEKNYDQ
ncbi:Response regulator receiver modulated diguanylate cyclase/phosphodiesterase [Planktothrix sp. PCC 11201]|uniref:two-component system response regulator n=1 Tax=Planktothrix sp. PCC 11201 TaxID=1729650 RepID=UPI00091FD58E|nr:GGDEF domain-containing response regulator [Planktothrix sp. PCC 11201]SKB12320.1 Response regulator receiver modulated diguanylate cyclase/phosphodiesterase [Planktothrix sp. PCC 11201]